MNKARLSELFTLLDEEFKKTPLDQARIAEINYYIGKEFAAPDPGWKLTLPSNWRLIVTSLIGALVALNSQFHFVAPNVQDAFLAVAISLGFWAVHANQNIQIQALKSQVMNLMLRKK